nr:unnamed protein product [Trichobilharzia regenti]
MNTLAGDLYKTATNYMKQIHEKVQEEKSAVCERQKRRRRVIMDILEAHHIQQEEIRSLQMMRRFSRQSHLESRISVQLGQIKQEKLNLLENRLERERQYEARRELEFQLAMDRERETAIQQKEEEKEKIAVLKQFWEEQKAERRQAAYKRHYDFIQNNIIPLLLQFAMNVAEYRTYTGKLIPLRLFRQWKIEFLHGLLLDDSLPKPKHTEDPVEEELTNQADQLELVPSQVFEEQQALLDDCDLDEYQNLVGDWDLTKIGTVHMKSLPSELTPHIQGQPVEWIDFHDELKSSELKLPNDICLLKSNPVLEWIIKRLCKINYPATPEPIESCLPQFPIKMALLGKPLSGKTTIIHELEKNHRCVGINPLQLIKEALKAYENKETEECFGETTDVLNLEESKPMPSSTLSSRAKLGEIIWNELKSGKEVPDSLIVDLIYEKIMILQPTTGFILDGFPATYNQAKLLEEKLTTCKSENNTPSDNSSTRPKLEDIQRSKGLDCVLLIDISDEIVLKRLAHTTLTKVDSNLPSTLMTLDAQEDIKTNPVSFHSDPAENDSHGAKDMADPQNSKTQPDSFNYSLTLQETEGNITERLIGFIQSWPKLYKFYHNKLSNLCVVNLTDLLVNSTYTHDFTENSSQGEIDYDPETDHESTKLAVYLEIERQIELLIEQKEKDRTKTPGTPANIDENEDIESRRTLLPSSTSEKVGSVKDDKKLDLNSDNKEDENMKVTKENTGSSPPFERPMTAKISPSAKNSRNSRQSDASKREKSAESHRKSAERRSPSTGNTSKHNDSKGKRINSGDHNKQVESLNRTKSRSRSSSEKKQSKKMKSKPNDSPQLVKPPDEDPTPRPKLPQPGDENYRFVDIPIIQETAQTLLKLWDSTQNIYQRNLKSIFRQIRLLDTNVIPYMYYIKQQFYNYLYRPDSKQHFVNQFISAFNALPNDMRADRETKADLHCRTDDLRDTLYEIIDESKQANENHLENLLDIPGWFTDKEKLLVNLYLSLFQVELTQFQEHAQLIKDYYNAMEAKPQTVEGEPIQSLAGTVDASHMEYTRIPLLKLPDDQSENNDNSDLRKSASTRQNSSRSSSNKGSKSKLTDSGNNSLSRYPTPIDSKFQNLPIEFRSQINLLNYNSSLQEVFASFSKSGFASATQNTALQPNQKGTKPTGAGKSNPAQEKICLSNPTNLLLDKTTSPSDPPLQFLYNVCLSVIQLVANQVQAERNLRASEAVLDGYTMESAIKPKDSKVNKPGSGDKSKGGQARKGPRKSIASKEKAFKSDEHSATPAELTDEEQRAREVRQHIREECIAALEREAAKTAFRLTLIRAQGTAIISDLQQKILQLRQFMTDCIGIKTLKEHDAVNGLLEVIRYTIEKEQKLPERMILDGEQFYIDETCITSLTYDDFSMMEKFRISSPIPKKLKESEPQYFSLVQLKYLLNELLALADSGFIDVPSFKAMVKPIVTERIAELTGSCSNDMSNELLECFVHQYSSLFESDFIKNPLLLDNNNEVINVSTKDKRQVYYVDWRQFLLAATQPAITHHNSTLITQSSLVILSQRLMELDQSVQHESLLTVNVTRAQFQFASFKWFPTGVKHYEELHDFLFGIFAKSAEANSQAGQRTESKSNSQCEVKPSLEETTDCSDLMLYISLLVVKSPYIGFLRCLSSLLGRHVPYISVHGLLTVDQPNIEREGVPERCPDEPITKEVLEKVFSFGLVKTCQSRNNFLQEPQVLDASEPGTFLISDKLRDIYSSLEITGRMPTLYNLLHNADFQNLLLNSLSRFNGIPQFSEPWPLILSSSAV